MKKIIKLFLVIAILSMLTMATGCTTDRNIRLEKKDGTTQTYNVKPYGLFNPSKAYPNVEYKASAGNIILSIIFIETVFVPIILIGWYLYQPVGPLTNYDDFK